MNPLEVTSKFYALCGAGDIEGMLKTCVAATALLDNPLPAPVPFGGIYE